MIERGHQALQEQTVALTILRQRPDRPTAGGVTVGSGRHRRPPSAPDRHVVALIAAAVALLLAAGISVVAFAAAATDAPPRHGRWP